MTAASVVSFDLDGTLIAGPFPRVLADLDAALATQPGGQGARRDILARHKQLLSTDVLAAYDWESIVTQWLDDHGLAAPFALLDRLADHVTDGVRFLHPDTLGLVQRLRSHGRRVVVVTNGWRRFQIPVLQACGLLTVVDEVICSDDAGEPKPWRAMFDAARAGAPDLVHVGDRIDHDVIGGNAAGARTLLLRSDVPFRGPSVGREDELTGYLHQRMAAESSDPPITASPVPTLLAASLDEAVELVLGGHRTVPRT